MRSNTQMFRYSTVNGVDASVNSSIDATPMGSQSVFSIGVVFSKLMVNRCIIENKGVGEFIA